MQIAESVGQDQPAHTCGMSLLCTHLCSVSTPSQNKCFGGILEAACLSVLPCACVFVLVSVCIQNTSFCQSASGGIIPLPNDKNLTLSKLKAFADDKINVNINDTFIEYKTLWEKEKILSTSIFSFSHYVLKRLLSQTRQKVSLCGNGLSHV